ncbi:protein cordon-bleu isoform X4 [Trichosurus vulpecula]|uniref:protein cordon-bleu isoform X4 n=1 Tax=Trichosurus vulpecula TaxID=9337 RepID=UPI00186B0375|nr:protein cordon-bleu isoform X4 [Trichosurus vulpecula]
MDSLSSLPASGAKPPSGRKMKARAPPPPGKPPTTPNIHSDQKPNRGLGIIPQQNLVNMKENLRSSVVDVTVVLPNGLETKSAINGSNAMMDLLVELCLQNHLNPAHYTLELRSLETQQPLSFKPNTLIGTLDVHTIFLKEKVPEEKSKPVLQKVPEKSVRLVVNYLRTQKTVVRVSPDVPLQNILPVICAKCEVSPEHVILLRDNIAGEELELSKSLNELGIKELYAWDNKRVLLTKTQSEPSLVYRETYRKSLGSDVMDKEKKKFLGFFKVNKRSNKAEQHGMLRVDSDEDVLKSTTEKNFNGCLTTPNSPSVNSRSLTLGPSLSLSNISGVSSDIKKRRAPPPPSATPSVTPSATPSLPSTEAIGQDKMSEKVSQASQNELQKKKRRAPAPPPPPPPPSTPLIPNRIDDKEENRKSTMVSLPLIHSSNCSVDGMITELSEVEETASVSSCFASEDTTTEDSGVMSSPSDIVSLDSQNDSVKSKDKWALDQEDATDTYVTCAVELGPPRSASRESDDSGITHLRNEKAITAKDDDDIFINGQLQKTEAKFDEDLEELEDSYETDTNSLTDSTSGVPSSHGREVIVPKDNAYTIPVTFIGEVLDDPVDLGTFINKNNNAGSFDMEHAANKATYITESPVYDQPYKAKTNHLLVKKRENVFESYVSSCEMSKEKGLAPSNNCKNICPGELKPMVASSTVKPQIGDLSLKENNSQGHESNGIQRSHMNKKMISELTMEKQTCDKNDLIVPSSWYYRGQNPVGPKAGLTTYKIVPPKSEMKCYDRGVSLTTGAIKIDELGNLVNPHVNGKKSTLIPSVSEMETLPIGKVKEFWRSNSIERHPDGSVDCTKRGTATLPLKQHHKETKLKAEPEFLDPKLKASQPASHRVVENNSELDKSKPPTMSVTSTTQAKAPVATPANPMGETLPFLKPQRRTSSQYVASAIAKRMETPPVNTSSFSKSKREQSAWEHQKLRQDLTPPLEKETLLNCTHPVTKASKNDPKRSYSDCWVGHGKESIKPTIGASSEMENREVNIKPFAQDSSADSYKQSITGPLTKSSPNIDYSVEVCGYNGKHSYSYQKTSIVCDPKCKTDNANSSSLARSPGFQTSSGSTSSSTKWPCVSNNNQNAAGVNGQSVLKREDRPDALSAPENELESPLQATVFGPKKKFKPIVQKPAPKDTSLHSALMEAIQTAGGKEKLRKTAEHSPEGSLKKPSYTEPESERSALLAAIRGHSGASSLKKVSSSASGELQSFREAALSKQAVEAPPQEEEPHIPPPPVAPPLPSHVSSISIVSKMTPKFPTGPMSDPADARQALMDAIRSGTGAARLKKVPLLV